MHPLSSPVVEPFKAKKIKQLPVREIIDGYLQNYGVDISPFVQSDSLEIHECEETGLRFYRGILPGDGPFYAKLMEQEWYYTPWKWEHEEAATYLSSTDNILEIGCGTGGFLERIAPKVQRAVGLELNEEAVKACRNKGLDVENADLIDYSSIHEGHFDAVFAFQLFEHIVNVGDFMRAASRLLKPGGKLIFGVPNNGSFIAHTEEDYLNMPPHHMNLWTEDSIKRAAPHVDCVFHECRTEPLQPYHQNWYVLTILTNNKSEIQKVPRILRSYFYKLLRIVLKNWVEREADNINGHTILAVYKKN